MTYPSKLNRLSETGTRQSSPGRLLGLALVLVLAVAGCRASAETVSDSQRAARADATPITAPANPVDAHAALDAAVARLSRFLDRPAVDGQIPRSLDPSGAAEPSPAREWTSGFYPAMLWELYGYSGDKSFEEAARRWSEVVEPEKWNARTHDMGFKIYLPFGAGYRLESDNYYRNVIVEAADTLMTRYSPEVGGTRSWDWGTWTFPIIIDNMMNLELLFAATRLTGDSTYYHVAEEHARTSIRDHFRPDYSSFHVVDYDAATGEPLRYVTHQGYSDASAWSRGQAWALYGYTMTYRETGELDFLNQAKNIAEFILTHPHLPDDFVPYWDFNAPDIPNAPRDASAGAIIASALYELSEYAPAQQERYLNAADRMLASLSRDYLVPDALDEPFLLAHSTGNLPRGSEIDVPIIYADYYYVEALLRRHRMDTAGDRRQVNINGGWGYLEKSLNGVDEVRAQADWEPVTLPHSWNAWDTMDGEPGYRRAASWYKRNVVLPEDLRDRRYVLHFEGAAYTSEVYVNGRRAGGHAGGFVGFDVDMTPHARPGANEVLVRVTNEFDPQLIPSQKGDYYLYGGITRNVFLRDLPATYLEQVHVRTPNVSHDRADTQVSVWTTNHDDARYDVVVELRDPEGNVLQRRESTAARQGELAAEFAFDPVTSPRLWSTHNPTLYSVRTELRRDGQLVDELTHAIGYRWFEFEEHGAFYLNGERLLLRGTHRHEDYAGHASAVPDSLQRKDMHLMKDMGANFVRLGHYPQAPVIYRMADSLGLLLWDELPWNRGGVGDDVWMENSERLFRTQINQNFNHPSIIIWSVGNEVYWLPDFEGGGDIDRLNRAVTRLHDLAKEMDPDRLTGIRKYYEGSHLIDVFSPSIWAGWYSGVYTAYERAITEAQQEYPALIHTEYGGASHVGRHTENPIDGHGMVDPNEWDEAVVQVSVSNVAREGDTSESYIVDLFDWHLMVSETLPNFSGNAQWSIKDFGTPLRPEKPIAYMNQKGLTDRAGRPKDAYYVFKSYWTTDPAFCYIVSKTWTERQGRQGEPRQVRAYCNTEEARLYLNGQDLEIRTKDITSFPASGLVWDVEFSEGLNELEVVGYNNGVAVTRDTHELTYFYTPHGTAQDLSLTPHRLPNGNILVEAIAMDRNGRRVLDYEELVYFDHNGDGRLLVDYGTPDRSQRVGMANGRAVIEFEPDEDGRGVVNVYNHDFKGTYIVLPNPEPMRAADH